MCPSEISAAPPPSARPAHAGTVTDAAVAFIRSARYETVPEDALAVARRCILDSTGLFLAGLSERSTAILIGSALRQGGAPDALLLGAGATRVPAPVAARVLATSGHAHDWDDTQVSHDPAHVYGLLTHPSIPPLTAAITVCDMLGGRSGRDLVTAFCVGFEVACKISEWMRPDHYLRGHHSSGTVGTFAAAATAAHLLGLGDAATAHALGIAGSFAAGIRCNFGTMTKPLHVGRAAENGVLAALLAQDGFTADGAVLDGPWGFPTVLSGGFDPDKVGQGFGRTWTIVDPGVSIKPYPSGILTHQSMDLVRRLVVEHDIAPGMVDRVEFHAGDNILKPIRYPVARTGLEAKFSMAALIAMLIRHRKAGIEQFSDEAVGDPAFQALQRRITTHRDPGINAQGFDLIRSRVVFHLTDGRRVEGWADTRYRGGPSLPMSEADLVDKFTDCTAAILDRPDREALIETIGAIDGLPDAGAYIDRLRVQCPAAPLVIDLPAPPAEAGHA
ncbi:MmgE/PrpD family protein [Arenibaculum sp.]|uniref:MmgE/PrpD family protein n=1 Tax=Arenibaculum sp. TaxID=2865862 RepID=UPI002E0E199D|nr:MmgE/PrpD family protein [Arenibaculum sp.]